MKRLKAILSFLSGLLAVARWLPFLGKYRELVLVASTILTAIGGIVAKCESDATDPAKPESTKTPQPTPEATSIHTPSPSPTPTPTPQIVLDRLPQVGWPFVVRYTAPFAYSRHLWIDKYRLQVLGKESGTNYHIAYNIVLNTGGKRLLTVRDNEGNVLASKSIEIKP